MKKIYLSVIGVLVTIGVVLALWLSGPAITGYSVYKIKSNQPNLTITRSLINGTLDTQTSSVNLTDTFKIDSTDKMKVQLAIITAKIDENDSCIDYENDCNVSYFLGEAYGYGFPQLQEIHNGDLIELSVGENSFSIFLNCQKLSCPQDIQSTLSLTPKKDNE